MHVIAPRTVHGFAAKHVDAAKALAQWLTNARKADWASLQGVRQLYPATDSVKVGSGRIVFVFNIKGNAYRLIAAIHFNRRKVFILGFMTHAQYSRNAWKDQL